jgi:hypothetical protein
MIRAIIILLILAVVGLIVLMGLTIIDTVGITPTKSVITIVEVKQVVPAHTSNVLVGHIPAHLHHPESYKLYFKIDEEELSPEVEKKFFDDVKVGDKIEVDYGFGRLSNSHQPTQIKLAAR